MNKVWDCIIVGGGLYGSMIALHLTKKGKKVLILEEQSSLLQRASACNQAVVHKGYHYPRSLLTGHSSSKNSKRFAEDFPTAVHEDFVKFHVIARKGSLTNVNDYINFCINVGIEAKASAGLKDYLNHDLIEGHFETPEASFNVDIVRKQLSDNIEKEGVSIYYDTKVSHIEGNKVFIADSEEILESPEIILCAYAATNNILGASNLETHELKYQLAEMCLVKVPEEFKKIGVTVMDGPFFSLVPFPALSCHILSHVTHTVQAQWRSAMAVTSNGSINTQFDAMKRDVIKFIPKLAEMSHLGSIFETKALFPLSAHDDGRPILFSRSKINPAVISIIGAKLDNVYDVLDEYDSQSSHITNVVNSTT